MANKFGLVCNTLFQGLTMSKGDIYETEAKAREEYADMRRERLASDMEEDDDFSIIEIVQVGDGWQDLFGETITVTDAGTAPISGPLDDRLNDISEELRDSTAEERDLANEQYGDNDLQIDDDAKVAEIEGTENIWVQAWVYVRK
jgi:hypothetical protein